MAEDAQMRKFVNRHRRQFLEELQTEVFMDGFHLPFCIRQRIQAALKHEGSFAANRILLDAITREENFASSFIKFCRKHDVCRGLARLLESALQKTAEKRKPPSIGAAGTQSVEQRLHQRENASKDHHTQRSGTMQVTYNIDTSDTLEDASNESSSFFLPSANFANADNLHRIEDLKLANNLNRGVEFSTDSGTQNMSKTIVATQFITSPGKCAGVQCQEDIDKSKLNSQSNSLLKDTDQTNPKTVGLESDSDEETELKSLIQNEKESTLTGELALEGPSNGESHVDATEESRLINQRAELFANDTNCVEEPINDFSRRDDPDVQPENSIVEQTEQKVNIEVMCFPDENSTWNCSLTNYQPVHSIPNEMDNGIPSSGLSVNETFDSETSFLPNVQINLDYILRQPIVTDLMDSLLSSLHL